ncbi:MAG: methyltransferase domain-containing protein [Promethearchaeota archaeon]|nr:MAG: methyltransferase domain-containing protein [Candidatus Lokiarchaeota archaeon]
MKFKDFAEKLATHTKKPVGPFGRIVGEYMGKIHQNVTEWGLDKVKINSNAIVLEIGCGAGYNINNLTKIVKNGKIYGIDYSETMVKLASENNKNHIEKGQVEIRYGTVSSLPFSENTFDIIMGVETVNFWPKIIDDLIEIRRTLKPNGTLILINNSYKNKKFKKRNKNWKKLTNFNLYSPKQFKKFFEKAGLSNIEIFEKIEKNWILIKANK